MNEPKDFHVVVYAFEAIRQRANVEQLLRLIDGRPGTRCLLCSRVESAVHRQPRIKPDDRLVAIGQRVDESGQIVFEKILLRRLEEGDDLLIAYSIGARKTKVDRVAEHLAVGYRPHRRTHLA